jgi:hypothetical protein
LAGSTACEYPNRAVTEPPHEFCGFQLRNVALVELNSFVVRLIWIPTSFVVIDARNHVDAGVDQPVRQTARATEKVDAHHIRHPS